MSYIVNNSDVLSLTDSTGAESAIINIEQADSVSYQLNYTDTTSIATHFVAADVNIDPSNSITIFSHGLFTGLKVALTGSNLPSGLTATTYWIIAPNGDTIKLATSLVNAQNGVAVTIATQGTTSDATLTPAALSQVVKLQQSNDGITFFDVSGLTVTVSSSGNTLWLVSNPPTKFHKIVVTPTGGALSLESIICERVIVNQ